MSFTASRARPSASVERPLSRQISIDAGLLIVNADDIGADAATTDAAVRCFDAGSITSATAMVFMADSDRAAETVRRRRLPVGLHLNLTQELDGEGVPVPVRDRHARIVAGFERTRAKHRAYRPLAQALVDRCVADQLAEFVRLFGRPPTHVDGHNHVHLSPNVLVSRSLPAGTKLRRGDDSQASRGGLARAVRAARRIAISRRFCTADRFLALRNLHPRYGGQGIEEALTAARRSSVELMVHPGWHDELELLLSAEWLRTIRGVPLGSFADLEPRMSSLSLSEGRTRHSALASG